MNLSPTARRLLARSERELGKREAGPGAKGVPLPDLLVRVNEVAVALLPEEGGRDSRVSREFTPRSFRHYQTLGCIDSPRRAGKGVVYGARHFLQALLVRRLLRERVPSDRIVVLLAGRGTEELRRMLLAGPELFSRPAAVAASSANIPGLTESWKRVVVGPGVELHLRSDLPKPRPGELKELLSKLESVLRRWGG